MTIMTQIMPASGEQKMIWVSRLTHAKQYQPLRTHRYAAKLSKSANYKVFLYYDFVYIN